MILQFGCENKEATRVVDPVSQTICLADFSFDKRAMLVRDVGSTISKLLAIKKSFTSSKLAILLSYVLPLYRK